MTDLKTILYQLKDHSVQPPAEILDAVSKVISEEKAEAAANNDLAAIMALKDKAVEPPAFLFEKIISGVKKKQSSLHILGFPKYVIRIAAGLLIILAIGIIARLTGNKGPLELASNGFDPADSLKSPAVNKALQNNTSPATAKYNASAIQVLNTDDKMIHSNTGKYTAHFRPNKNKADRHAIASVGGDEFSFQNNDLLFSFTNFNYNNLPTFITAENNGPVKITLDRSTSISLSEGMVSIMKRMYQQKRNGKPTFKARKEKRKLERWKNADTKFFDKNVEKNPMDPLDLAEFIF